MKLKKCLTVALGLTLLTSSIAVQAAAIEPKGEDLVIQTNETRNMEEDMDMGGDYSDVTVTQVPEYTGGDFTFFVDTKNLPKDSQVDFPEITLTNFPGNFIVGNEFTEINTVSGAITFKASAFEQMNSAIKSAGLENPTMTITGNLVSQETGAFMFFELSTTVRTSDVPETEQPPITPETPDVPETEQPPVTPETPDVPETEQPPVTPETPDVPETEYGSVIVTDKTETWNGAGDITVNVSVKGTENFMFKGVDATMNDFPFEANASYDSTTGIVTIPEKSLKEGLLEAKKTGLTDISTIKLAITFTSEDFQNNYFTVNSEVKVENLIEPEEVPVITPETPNTPIQGEKVDFSKNPKVEVKPVVHDIPKTGDMSQIATFATTGVSSLFGVLALLKRRK